MAFRRHRPVRFAAIVYLTWVGAAALTAEFAVPRLRDSTMFRFVLPLCMTTPALLGIVRDRPRGGRNGRYEPSN